MSNIADLYSRLGNYKEALTYSQNVLEIYIEFYGEQNHRVGLAYNNIAAIYEKLHEDQMALDYLAKSCEIYQTYGDSYPGLAVPYDLIGTIYLKHSMYDQAEKFIREGMRIREEAYGKDNLDVAMSQNNLANLFQEKGEYEEAEEMFLKALEIVRSHLGDKDPKTATLLANLGVLYGKQKNYAKALEYHLPALEIVEQYFPEDHPNRTLYRYGVADIYYRCKDFGNALLYLRPVYYDSLEKVGPEDKYTVHYFNFMNELYVNIFGAKYKSFQHLKCVIIPEIQIGKECVEIIQLSELEKKDILERVCFTPIDESFRYDWIYFSKLNTLDKIENRDIILKKLESTKFIKVKYGTNATSVEIIKQINNYISLLQ